MYAVLANFLIIRYVSLRQLPTAYGYLSHLLNVVLRFICWRSTRMWFSFINLLSVSREFEPFLNTFSAQSFGSIHLHQYLMTHCHHFSKFLKSIFCLWYAQFQCDTSTHTHYVRIIAAVKYFLLVCLTQWRVCRNIIPCACIPF